MKSANKLKTVVIVYDYAYINGGAAKVAIQSAIGLKEKGVNVIYFTAVAPIDRRLISAGVDVRCLNDSDISNKQNKFHALRTGVWNSTAKKGLLKVLESLQNEDTIVHFHGWSKALTASVVSAATKLKFSTVITLHEYFSVCPNGAFYNYRSRCICDLKPMSLSCIFCNCDKQSYGIKLFRVLRNTFWDFAVKRNAKIYYINISDKNKDVVLPWIKSEHFTKIYNPVELSKNKIADIKSNTSIVFIGRLSEEKGIDLYCKAVAELQSEESGLLDAVVIGGGSLYNSLKRKYPNITFTDWLESEQISNIILNSRALVFPSVWYEGAPLIIVEAMSAGLPCVVSDSTSATELIKHGSTGRVFKSRDINDLKANIKSIYNPDCAKELSDNIVEDFDLERYKTTYHIRELMNYYEGILYANN
jgi:glycosyltransferase involved in cell wall biosynthesis